MSRICAIIPARGGSKGIPRKNIVDLAGRPLIAYSIDHALASRRIDRVIVSTDDEKIAEVASKCGAEVPFLRPREIADDTTLDLPVFAHALHWLEQNERDRPEIIVHLRPTAPLRSAGQVDTMIELLEANPEADSIRSVSRPGPHPWRMFTIEADGFLHPLLAGIHPEPYLLRRQELPDVFWYNAVTDCTRRRTILEKHSMTGTKILPYVIENRDVVDIDEADDLLVAAVKLERFSRKPL